MFNTEGRPIIIESVVELANFVMELANSIADSCENLARIYIWVRPLQEIGELQRPPWYLLHR